MMSGSCLADGFAANVLDLLGAACAETETDFFCFVLAGCASMIGTPTDRHAALLFIERSLFLFVTSKGVCLLVIESSCRFVLHP